ncbi:MAG TPA: DUF4465 domain-containing protein [Cytophagaceae bacterium]|jgi:hypothetical protein
MKHCHKRKNLFLRNIDYIVLAGSVFITMSFAQAQKISSFDELSLVADTFWNGSDLSRGFRSGDAFFKNKYTVSGKYKYWSGFSYSNMKDISTPGDTNQYSAFAGGGHNSIIYAIANGNKNTIVLDGESRSKQLDGFYITNTTYTGLSMKNGDRFAKKFGGKTTNDPDWFKVRIFGYKAGKATRDTVDFYLADYRFEDNSKDYILNTWEYVDLSLLGTVDSVGFSLSSSDVGEWGMNTPAYFAMDDFNSENTLTAIEYNDNSTSTFYPNPAVDNIFIELNQSVEEINLLTVTDLTGRVVYSNANVSQNTLNIAVGHLSSGVYHLNIVQKDKTQHLPFFKQ